VYVPCPKGGNESIAISILENIRSPSVITTRSIHDLDLKVGSEVIALVKSTDVSIAKLQ
jgi:molybdopterin-binding protein